MLYAILMLLSINPRSRKRNVLRWRIAVASVSLDCERDPHIPRRIAPRAQSGELL